MEIAAKDLRTQTRQLLETVERGEEVIITYRGTPRARVVPLEATLAPEEPSELFGLWKDHSDVQDVEGYVDELRQERWR